MIEFVKKLVYYIFCKFFYRVEYLDKQNEESLDKCLICANHSFWVDPIFIYSVTKNLYVMAKAELFKIGVIGKIFRYFGIFPINRGKKDSTSILHSVNILIDNPNSKLLVFPEGTRVKKIDEHVNAKKGAVYIALKAKVPIVPIYITRRPRIFSKVYVKYGKPIYLDFDKHDDKEYISVKSQEVLDIIYSMK
jgi:1-acyl-sn-glycerol-3-phosphate acyltransferase